MGEYMGRAGFHPVIVGRYMRHLWVQKLLYIMMDYNNFGWNIWKSILLCDQFDQFNKTKIYIIEMQWVWLDCFSIKTFLTEFCLVIINLPICQYTHPIPICPNRNIPPWKRHRHAHTLPIIPCRMYFHPPICSKVPISKNPASLHF